MPANGRKQDLSQASPSPDKLSLDSLKEYHHSDCYFDAVGNDYPCICGLTPKIQAWRDQQVAEEKIKLANMPISALPSYFLHDEDVRAAIAEQRQRGGIS